MNLNSVDRYSSGFPPCSEEADAVSCGSADTEKDAFSASTTVGNVRIQFLSPTLIRIEQRGPSGFEDRCTFTVVERMWPGIPWTRRETSVGMMLETAFYRICLPEHTVSSASLAGIRVESLEGKELFVASGDPVKEMFFPDPWKPCDVWIMQDAPRLIPPAWGATPPPEGFCGVHSGWDPDNAAQDIYIFIPGAGGGRQVRADFLRLTGRIPLPPIYSFGMIDSRYHAYTEETALEVIDRYRNKEIPIDVFVLDTDWRVGASHGYKVATDLFPDMSQFLEKAHQRKVRVMFNDHPEPVYNDALDAREFQYRWDGLTGILAMGGDILWYDRNWKIQLKDPVPGLDKNVWGQRLYHDIVQRYNPNERPLIMSNVQGIDDGLLVAPPHPASHRFPIWWTGDTYAKWEHLQRGITNAVNSGICSLIPYINEDLGGHHGTPSPDLYLRFIQYGVFSPAVRVHCSKGSERYPWSFGNEVEKYASEFIRLRYRILPLIYAAARQAYEDGTPLLRRCDYEWPEHAEAVNPLQYLFGENLLVAPITTGCNHYVKVPSLFLGRNGVSGVKMEYFDNASFMGTPLNVQKEAQVSYGPAKTPPSPCANAAFSIRWSGEITNLTESGIYRIGAECFGSFQLWIDDNLVVEKTEGTSDLATLVEVYLNKEKRHSFRLEYRSNSWSYYLCQLVWETPVILANKPGRNVWIPPGEWIDAWTEERITGPQSISVISPLWHIPIYVRSGGVILSIPQRYHIEKDGWDEVVIDAYINGKEMRQTSVLYEDDGCTNAYEKGAYCETKITLESSALGIHLEIGPKRGNFDGALDRRSWVIRLHLPPLFEVGQILVDEITAAVGTTADSSNLAVEWLSRSKETWVFPFGGAGSLPPSKSEPILQIRLFESGVCRKRSIHIDK